MTLHHTALSFALSALALTACAQTGPASSHDEHHSAAAATSSTPDPMAAMDKQIKAMEEMHIKMLNTKTPQERQALMAEHHKLMQEGMAMMDMMRNDTQGAKGGMGSMMGVGGEHKAGGMCDAKSGDSKTGSGCSLKGNAMAKQQQMMEKRMEMMKSMMQMMMDRMYDVSMKPTLPANPQ